MENNRLGTVLGITNPKELLERVTSCFIHVCKTMLNLPLQPEGFPTIFDPEHVIYGSNITVSTDQDSLRLAIGLDRPSCEALVKALQMKALYSTPTEEDVADSLGELLNMTAGMLVRSFQSLEGKHAEIGLPEFLQLKDFFDLIGKGFYLRTQRVIGSKLSIQVILLAILDVDIGK